MCDNADSYFPYKSFRRGQREFIKVLCESLKRKGITLVEAPNGMGKTSGVLTVISYLAEKGMRFLYLVRTHRQIDRVIEECRRFKELRLAAVRGKRELCRNPKAKRLSNYTSFITKCNELRKIGACPYYEASKSHPVFERCYDPLRVRSDTCPYYEALESVREGEYHALVLSYTYLLDPDVRAHIKEILREGVSLIVDEAHNLKRYWLAHLMRKVDLNELRSLFDVMCCDRGRELIASFLRSNLEYLELPKDYALRIFSGCDPPDYTPWESRVLYLNLREEVLISWKILLTREELIITRRPEETLEDILRRYHSSTLISGTWGGEEACKGEFLSRVRYVSIPLEKWGEIEVLITRDFTTRFEERRKIEYYRLATVLADLSKKIVGNMGVFTASYDVLAGLLEVGFQYLLEKPLFIEERGADVRRNLKMVERYKELSREGAILLGVQGGRNSEGEDFPGLQMTTSVVIGLQLSKPGVERELTRLLWNRHSALRNPDLIYGCRSAFQAAARPVRSPDDLGFIVLADRRFESCLKMMPSWMRRKVRLVSLEDIPSLADEFFSVRSHLFQAGRIGATYGANDHLLHS